MTEAQFLHMIVLIIAGLFGTRIYTNEVGVQLYYSGTCLEWPPLGPNFLAALSLVQNTMQAVDTHVTQCLNAKIDSNPSSASNAPDFTMNTGL